MTGLEAGLTIGVLIGIAVLVLAFEKRRAQRIERDLRDQARRRGHQDGGRDPDD